MDQMLDVIHHVVCIALDLIQKQSGTSQLCVERVRDQDVLILMEELAMKILATTK